MQPNDEGEYQDPSDRIYMATVIVIGVVAIIGLLIFGA